MMTTIEKNVMANVALIYTMRRLLGPTALKLYVCVLCLWGVASLVWVAKVFENLAHVGAAGSLQFVIAAVLNTDVLVQLTLLVGALAAASLLLDLFRSFSRKPLLA
jgi:hypothetical protein